MGIALSRPHQDLVSPGSNKANEAGNKPVNEHPSKIQIPAIEYSKAVRRLEQMSFKHQQRLLRPHAMFEDTYKVIRGSHKVSTRYQIVVRSSRPESVIPSFKIQDN